MNSHAKRLQFQMDAWANLYIFADENRLASLADFAAAKIWATHLTAEAAGVDLLIGNAD